TTGWAPILNDRTQPLQNTPIIKNTHHLGFPFAPTERKITNTLKCLQTHSSSLLLLSNFHRTLITTTINRTITNISTSHREFLNLTSNLSNITTFTSRYYHHACRVKTSKAKSSSHTNIHDNRPLKERDTTRPKVK